MPELEGTIGEELYERLRTKWDLKSEPDINRANLTAVILDNQKRHFDRLAEELPAESEGLTKLKTWSATLYEALKDQLRTHPLPDLCSMQPMTGPVGIVFFYRTRIGEMEDATTVDGNGVETKVKIPTVVLDVVDQAIQAEPRRVKAFRGLDTPTMGMVIEELLSEISREVLNTMLSTVPAATTVVAEEGADLKEKLAQTSHRIHRATQRGPADRVVANAEMLTKLGVDVPISNGQIQEVCVLDGKWRVYLDPYFPKGKLLAWNHGTSPRDTGLIYSPYIMFQLSQTFIDPPKDMCIDGAPRIRHKITLVRPEFAGLIEQA